MTHGSLFSGIGGFDLAAECLGIKNIFHCEINTFGRRVLQYHFPNSESYDDITKTDFTQYRNRITILSGGFPCQPFSTAGKRMGAEDDRYLWPEMLRVINEIRPRWVIGENVAGILSVVQPIGVAQMASETDLFGAVSDTETQRHEYIAERVCRDLEGLGYSVIPFIIPACSVGAPHRRDRIWFVAHSSVTRAKGEQWRAERPNGFETSSNADSVKLEDGDGEGIRKISEKIGIETFGFPTSWEMFPSVAPICGGDDGLPKELDSITFSKWREKTIEAYGNAIVPQVAYEIMRMIKQIEEDDN